MRGRPPSRAQKSVLVHENMRGTKSFSYYMAVKEALLSHPRRRATAAEVFEYVSTHHPLLAPPAVCTRPALWKNTVRQLLTICPEFVKLPRAPHARAHCWAFVPLSQVVSEQTLLAEYLRTSDAAPPHEEENKRNASAPRKARMPEQPI